MTLIKHDSVILMATYSKVIYQNFTDKASTPLADLCPSDHKQDAVLSVRLEVQLEVKLVSESVSTTGIHGGVPIPTKPQASHGCQVYHLVPVSM